MLQLILRNLLSNAIKFSHPKNRIAIDVAKDKMHLIKITVTDWGIGIPKDRLPGLLSIKENFKQIGTAEEKGTGLGLILCDEFIRKHGGNLTIQSTQKEGTSVTFTLPTTS